MADVTYNTSSFPSLIRTIRSLIQLSTDKNSTPRFILLGYKERDPAERDLWQMATEVGITFEEIGQLTGKGGTPAEVWIGKMNSSADIPSRNV